MEQFYQTQVYLTAIRSPTKTLKHCCTRQTQLERISKNLSWPELQFSLYHSKMLKNFLQNHPLHEKFNQQVFQQMCHIKGITNQQNKFYVRKVINQYQCHKFSLRKLQQIRKQKYNKENVQHQQFLLQIWKNLKPKEQLKNRISDQWIQIGFQANDPATDFRGAGYLGLLNLVLFTRNKKCKSVFQWAIHQDTQYFFCSAGLFFTMTAIQLSKQKLVPVEYWMFKQQSQILNRFQSFDNFWRNGVKNKSILQFNNNLLRFKQIVRTFPESKIKQKIIYWQEV